MKKISLLISYVMAVAACFAQDYNYTPWQPSMGPITFNTLGDAQHPYAQCKVSMDWHTPAATVTPINTAILDPEATATSHAIITSNTADPCRCYSIGNNNYPHDNFLPPAWDGTPGAYQDTVIRIGCGINNNTCYRAAQIEYWLYPDEENSTLLVMSSFALVNASTSHGVITSNTGGCAYITNQQFFVEVYDGESGDLLDLGYYPTQASQQTDNPIPNLNWPHSSFLSWPSGCSADLDFVTQPDNLGIVTYYWAGQTNTNGSFNANGFATPTTFPFRECPGSQTGGTSGSYPVQWFEYKPLAFDLKSIATQNLDANGNFVPNKSIKLRIRTIGCSATAHWSYGLVTAKTIPGEIPALACGDEDICLSAPQGFMEQTYVWHYGYDSLDANNKILDLSSLPPGISTNMNMDIVIDPSTAQVYPYYRCETKSYTSVPFVFEAHVRKHVIEADFNYQQDFNAEAPLTAVFQNTSTRQELTPPSQSGGSWDTAVLPVRLEWFVLQRNGVFRPFGANLYMPTLTFDSTTINSDGTATVRLVVSDWNGHCSDTVTHEIQLTGVGIHTHTEHRLSVTPNPTNGMVNVSSDEMISEISIMGSDGKLLETIQCGTTTTTLNLAKYPGSLYLLNIRFANGTISTEKVLKR